MADRLAGFFDRYPFVSRVFYNGTLCRNETFDHCGGVGHLHLVRRGPIKVNSTAHAPFVVTEPSLLFYPKPESHEFIIEQDQGAELLCATIDLGHRDGNPLTKSLPSVILIPFQSMPEISTTLELLFHEASQSRCGHQAAIDRLAGYLLIQILRHVLDHGESDIGLLAGLADPRLARALSAIHENPGEAWSLEKLSTLAGMSRARFATNFRDTVGMTPGEYLAQWRVNLAQALLKQGKPMGLIADAVGYGSATALSRAFKSYTGNAPREWLRMVCIEPQ